jgi:predicted alpha/beta-hydrolase family hydrolase
MLFVQGTRDAFGTPDELAPILARVMPPPTVHAISGGDHSFKVSGRDKGKQTAVYEEIQGAIISWMSAITSHRGDGS